MPGLLGGLSMRLIAAMVLVILSVEIVVYLPSAASFRSSWLNDRLRVGLVAARVLDAVPDAMDLPRTLTDRLLRSAEAMAIVYRREGQSQLIGLDGAPMPREAVTADMRIADLGTQIYGVFDTLVAPPGRMLRIVGDEDGDAERTVEVLMPEAPLRAALFSYSVNLVLLSLSLALVTSAVLYVLIARLLIGPIRRLAGNMIRFSSAPENATLIVTPSPRRDEIGMLERELNSMETDLFSMLRQQRHLADLGLAVAKINHDLRNTLTSAQLLSDQVANLDDPKVQRLAPRLVQSIDKAIGFAQQVLDYGRQRVVPPVPRRVEMRKLIDDAGFEARLVAHPNVRFFNEVPADLALRLDADQSARIFVNLLKNAREALEASFEKLEVAEVRVMAELRGEAMVLSVIDTGPGLPPRARDNLFVAFEGSARAGGTGLGLAIARELAEAQGGQLTLAESARGTRFELSLPTSLVTRQG
jgi:signal transduction histidine kinase